MKILHVVNSLEPGGMENGVVNVASALDPAEFDVHVACLERSGAFAERLPKRDQVTVLGKKSGFSPGAVMQLASEISRIRPALIHSHNIGPLIYSSLATLGGMTCPVLQGEHASLTEEECSPRRLRQRRWFYRCCKQVHTVAHGLTNHLIELGFPPGKITTIVNGVDTGRFSPGDRLDARRKINLPDNALVVGIVGRFGPFKRHAMLLESFIQLGAEYPNLHLLIVGGGGSQEKEISQRVQSHPHATRIHLAGFQKNTAPFYQAMDLLVVPSINEGLSNAVLEAMACGVPVLANSACGNGDVIVNDKDGMVVDLGTPQKLGMQLASHLAKPSFLAEIGIEARRKAVSTFSMEKMVSGYAGLYQKVGNRKSG